MHHLGIDGYQRLTKATIDTTRAHGRGHPAPSPASRVLGEPEAQLVAMATAGPTTLDVFAVGDALLAQGWHHDRQSPPDTLHATVSAGNAPVIDEYLADLARVRRRGRAAPAPTTAPPTTPPWSKPTCRCQMAESAY